MVYIDKIGFSLMHDTLEYGNKTDRCGETHVIQHVAEYAGIEGSSGFQKKSMPAIVVFCKGFVLVANMRSM